MKNCEYYEEQIGALLDGELAADGEAELRAHLKECENCRCFYEALCAVSGLEETLPEPPESFTADVMARLHTVPAPNTAAEEKQAKKKTDIRRLVTRCGALAAAAAVAVWAGARFSGGMEKSADTAMPETAEYSLESGSAYNAAPVEEPAAAYGRMSEAAEDECAPAESAPTEEDGAAFTVTVSMHGGESAERPYDAFFSDRLLSDGGSVAAPEREPDYTLTLTAPDTVERVCRLWLEESAVIWQEEGAKTAHRSSATPEEVREALNNESEQ